MALPILRSASLASILLSACSWIAVTPPPTGGYASSHLGCTESRAAPVVDTLAGTLLGLGGITGGVIGLAHPTGREGPESVVKFFGAISLGIGVVSGVLYGLSAHYGYSRTMRCEDLKAGRRNSERATDARAAPQLILNAPPAALRDRGPAWVSAIPAPSPSPRPGWGR